MKQRITLKIAGKETQHLVDAEREEVIRAAADRINQEIDALRETDPTMTEIYTRHPFDEFDYRYMEIWAKTDLNQRFLDFAAQHPEIYDNERSAGDCRAASGNLRY